MRAYLANIREAVVTIAKGLLVTGLHIFKPSVTQQYVADERPWERWRSPVVPEGLLKQRSRMRLHVKWEDCIGCKQCERACPVDCINITAEKRDKAAPPIYASDGTAIKQSVVEFYIDMSLCCYCALCTYPCPTACIVMTPEFEFAEVDKGNLLYRFAKGRAAPTLPTAEPQPADSGGH